MKPPLLPLMLLAATALHAEDTPQVGPESVESFVLPVDGQPVAISSTITINGATIRNLEELKATLGNLLNAEQTQNASIVIKELLKEIGKPDFDLVLNPPTKIQESFIVIQPGAGDGQNKGVIVRRINESENSTEQGTGEKEPSAKVSGQIRKIEVKARPAAFLGVVLAPSKPAEGKTGEGIQVASVAQSSPAEKAGIQAGDSISKLNGMALDQAEQLVKSIAASSPGEEVQIEIIRGGEVKNLSAKLGGKEESTAAIPQTGSSQIILNGSAFTLHNGQPLPPQFETLILEVADPAQSPKTAKSEQESGKQAQLKDVEAQLESQIKVLTEKTAELNRLLKTMREAKQAD